VKPEKLSGLSPGKAADHMTFPPRGPHLGLDEAGRGCLAGPVSAAVLLVPSGFDFSVFPGLTDSKKLSPARREVLARAILDSGLIWGLGLSWPPEIDRVNILNASFRAMSRAVLAAAAKAREISGLPLFVDGPFAIPAAQWRLSRKNPLLPAPPPQFPIIRGDALLPAISAASVLAKTWRDKLMAALDRRWPDYAFARHKGYATRMHLEKIALYGLSPQHRRSFRIPTRCKEKQLGLFIQE
jgi:ribonuclease HII